MEEMPVARTDGGSPSPTKAVRGLLICGITSSALYIGTDVVAATVLYPGYRYLDQQVSELAAIGAPTRYLWNVMTIAWALLVIAFALGVWRTAGQKRSLRVTAVLLAGSGVIGMLWMLAPMHPTGTAELSADTGHIVFAALQVLVMVLFIAFGSGVRGLGFRIYSVATILMMLAAGIVNSTKAQAIAAGQSTPWMGAVERVSVYLPVVWVGAFAGVLLLASSGTRPATKPEGHARLGLSS